MPRLPSLLFSIMCRIQGGTGRILIAPRHGEVKTGSERSLSSGAAVDTLYHGLAYINTASLTERRKKGQMQKKESNLTADWGFWVSQAQMMCEMSFHWWLSASDDNADGLLFFNKLYWDGFPNACRRQACSCSEPQMKMQLVCVAWLKPSSQTESAETCEITERCERGESFRKSWERENNRKPLCCLHKERVTCDDRLLSVRLGTCLWTILR